MTVASLVPLARACALVDDVPLAVDADGVPLVVVRHRGGVSVFDGRCPHQGNLLADGEVVDGHLVCAAHGWRFDCASGRRAGDPRTCLHRFDARVVDGEVTIDAAELDVFRMQRAGRDARAVRPFRSLPGPRGLPLVGNLFQLRETDQHLVMEDWADEYGPMYRIRLGPYRILMVADPLLVEDAFKRRPDTFRRMSTVEGIARGLKAAGVFTAEGDEWRRQRKVVVQALTHGHLKHFFPTMMRIVARLQRRWEQAADEGREIDLLDDLTRFTIDVTSTFAFGQDLNTIEGHEGTLEQQIGEIPRALSRRVTALVPYWNHVKLPADRALDRALVGIHDTLARLITDARRRLAEDPGLAARPGNYIESLVAQSEGGGFSDEDVTGNVMTLMLAGEETTARALAWLIHFMCERPDLRDTLRAESDALLGADELLQDFATHPRMVRIEAAALEAMRLKPAAPVLRLEALHDTVLGDVEVPARTPVFLLTRHATIRAQAATGAAAFDIERWIQPDGTTLDATSAKAFFPFGAGPRFCPGRFLALLEIKGVISMLCRNFELERAGSGPVEEKLVFTMRPDNLVIRLKRRAAQSPSPLRNQP
ncbi:cytochrome P450 [Luteimonas kalidii]|uniref:Cytochrome P450 n=1 Tax=Luteimonas kalidii TaxID=3042025 RepID=A0ABT6JW07_9GAMM|nr:cytochrome P450 [Luteimonas kalidii]MDH5834361.1 cytochrome P450 [Luteimonas kalidii]